MSQKIKGIEGGKKNGKTNHENVAMKSHARAIQKPG